MHDNKLHSGYEQNKPESFLDIAREYFPDATAGQLEYILWEYTGFPNFFEGDVETALRKQLQYHKDESIED